MSGPAFEHLDESEKKAAQKRLPAGLENPLRNLDAIVLKLCDKKFPPSLLEELTKHIPYKKSMLRKANESNDYVYVNIQKIVDRQRR